VRRLADVFASYTASDAEECDAVVQLLQLLQAPADPFDRTTLPVHVTASSLVLDPKARLLLLHLHRRLDRWLQPGGHIEPGERPEDAAQRETVEETGFLAQHPSGTPHVVHLDAHPGPDDHLHLDLRYLLLADSAAPALGQGEASGMGTGATLRWVALADVAGLTDTSLARAVVALERHLASAAAPR